MALTVQNLRAVGTGVEPASLLPGQICFNLTDKIIYVGDGSAFKTSFDGTQVPGVPGEGWYSMPMDFDSLGDYYVANPGYYGDVPTDQQVLTWSTALDHPIWTNGGGGGGNQVYVVTNADVAAAPGATTSDKITAAIGVASPDEGDTAIVTGLPDDVYEGLYFFTTEWIRGASYAYPSATEVIYDNTAHSTLSPTVQGAIDDLDDGLAATTAIANTANSTANSALSIANAALPKAGGTMTGTIIARNIVTQAGYTIQFDGGANGTLAAISDSISLTSSTTAASATAVRTAYLLAQAAIPRSTFTATGELIVGTGAGTFSPFGIGTPGQILAVNPTGTSVEWVSNSEGDVTSVTATLPITVDNLDPQNPVVGVNPATTAATGVVQVGNYLNVDGSGVLAADVATTSAPGVVQVGTNVQVSSGTISILDASTSQKGVVQLVNNTATNDATQALTAAQGASLQTQINGITISGTVTLAGSIDANTGLVSTVTSQGGTAVPPFVVNQVLPAPGAGNDNYYLIVTNPGTFTPTGGSTPVTSENGDWILSDGVTWQELAVGARPAYASDTTAGVVVLSTDGATQAGTDPLVAVTPKSLQSKLSDSTSTTSSTTIASSTAVKAAYDLANAALPKTGGTMTGNITFQDAGEGVVFNGGSSVYAISDSTSTTSSTTAASSTAAKAAYDIGAAAIPCSTITAVGDIVVGGAGPAPTALPVGTDGQVLVANSACASGLEWVTDVPGDVTGVNATFPITVDNTDPQQPIIGINGASTVAAGAVQLSDSVSSTSSLQASTPFATKAAYDLAAAAIPCSSFLAKGNLLGGTGAGTYSALTVGTDGQFLSANSACGAGLEWCTLSLACVPCSAYTAVGTILAGNGAGTYCSLPIGTNGQVLIPNTACAAGVEWVTKSALDLCGTTSIASPFRTLLGFCAGGALASGTNNTAVGYCSLATAANNDNMTAVGYQALRATTGTGNTALGSSSGQTLTSGSSNVFIGHSSANGVTTVSQSVAVGAASLASSTTSAANGTVAVGYGVLGALTTGCGNVGVGLRALDSVTTGSGNTAVGLCAGESISGATSGNTLIGCTAGQNLTTGAQNTLVGNAVGNAITTGGCNTIVGNYTGTTTLASNVILADGAGNRRFQANGSGAWSYNGTDFGTAGQVLASQGSAATPIWCTLSLACIPCSAFTTTGQILVGTGAGTFTALPVGTNGQVLVPNSSCSTGLEWITVGALCLNGYTCAATPFNTALGTNAGDSITTGTDNVAIGYNAGTAQAAGTQSVFVGSGAGQNTNGVGVTAIGFCAGQANIGGAGLTYVGWVSGRSATGGCNTYVGSSTGAGALNTSSCGTLLGWCAGGCLSSGSGNTLVGFQSGRFVTTGANNVAVGTAAFQTATTAASNVAVGCGALAGLSTSAGNTALGHRAMINASTAANNVVIGCSAGEQISTGSTNVFIGNTAGDAITTGSSNTIIGDIAGSTALANNLILAAGTTIKLQVNENGAVGVGTTPSYGTAGQILQSAGTAAAPTWVTSWQTQTTTLETVLQTTLLSLPVATTRSVQVFLTVSNTTTGRYHSDTYQVITDGTTANSQLTGGAAIGAGNAYTWAVSVSGGNLLLQVTPAASSSTKFVAQYFVTPV